MPARQAELVVARADKAAAGLYICLVRNSAGAVQAQAWLTVLQDWEAVSRPPENITATPGSTVRHQPRISLVRSTHIGTCSI